MGWNECLVGTRVKVGYFINPTFTGNYSNRFLGDMKTDRCIYAFNAIPVTQVQASLVSMDIDGFTLNFTVAGNITFSVRWKAIG